MIEKNIYREKLRLHWSEKISYPYLSLMAMVVGKGIINNPKIIREDDVLTGDVVFYEIEGVLND